MRYDDDIDEAPGDWKLDKRIPLGLAFVVLFNLVGGVWWLARLDSRVSEQNERIVKLEANDGTQTGMLQEIRERLARIDERLVLLLEQARPGKKS